MKNFVRIGIADAREQVWVGQRALEGVALALQNNTEVLEVALQDLQPARIVGGESALIEMDARVRAVGAPEGVPFSPAGQQKDLEQLPTLKTLLGIRRTRNENT